MLRSLRKGRSSVYFQHEHTGHSIGAEKYESNINEGIAILKFDLRPVDENQRHDEEYLRTRPLISLTIDDGAVIDGFIRHVETAEEEISGWKVMICSGNKNYIFVVDPKLSQIHQRKTLIFTVLNIHG